MANVIACPACNRVLSLPAEALNAQVQCPACKHQFHPAEASPPKNVRPAGANKESLPARELAAPVQRESAVPGPSGPRSRRSAAPPPATSYDPRRTGGRRGKREVEDLCPACQAFVPRGVNTCPECQAEFDPDDDEGYRPWEREGVERRDSEPHRGGWLLTFSIASMVTSIFFFFCYLGIATSLAGLVGGAVTIWMATNDLRKMREHVMNREGEMSTVAARICAIIGVILNLMALPVSIYFTSLVF